MKTKNDFPGLELEYYEMSEPETYEACVCCGASIKHVFYTNYGAMGGDCYATISGDNSTRSEVRRLIKKLDEKLEKVSSWDVVKILAYYKKEQRCYIIKIYQNNPYTDLIAYTLITKKEIVKNALISYIDIHYDYEIIVKE